MINCSIFDSRHKEMAMRELTLEETELVTGGNDKQISGYEGAGAVLVVLGTGAAIATAPISAPVVGISLGAAGGLATAQFLADYS
jgi:hypothetical protein